MTRRRRWPFVLAGVALLLGGAAWVVYGGGRHQGPGTVHPRALPAAAVARRDVGPSGRQILFGDLHVHTTFSVDAFLRSLPLLQGEGVHPPADACDFARFCSGLDFFALTDHAESITPRHWAETKETVRQCNAVAGDAHSPDLVAFTGFEWTQVGLTPETHYGHKNVIFRDVDEDRLPARPIAAGGTLAAALRNVSLDANMYLIPILDFSHRQAYLDFHTMRGEIAGTPVCPAGPAERALPAECLEVADTPRQLFDKLTDWGFPALVIPHGTTWGFYTPAGSDWKKQLAGPHNEPARQFLFEIYSGHGNSEEWRAWDGVTAGGTCPAPAPDYEPCCWRAGEIIRGRCGDAPAAECERRVRQAQANYLAAGPSGHLTVPGAAVEDWKDCGQCRDCFLPTYNMRPGGSAEFVLAHSTQPWGFLASSDNHSARPGTGYKEYARRGMTEATGARDELWHERGMPARPPGPESLAVDPRHPMVNPWLAVDVERQASFFLTGGLVAVHADGRSRAAIWDALQRREVYGTSGPRILLWFDVVNAPGGRRPMGSEVTMTEAPRFEVRALGSLEELPGCPDEPDGPAAARLARLCRGECHHPGDRRRAIVRIEVVRVRPRVSPDEPTAALVEDPWRTFPCEPVDGGCRVELDDPGYTAGARGVTYYVRAIEAPSAAVNGAGLRCERAPDGSCLRARPCYGDYRTAFDDDCLAPVEERAWSSPIFVRWP